MRDVKSAAGSIRAERAALTRRRIEDAARARFARDGYASATLRQIADDAGVAVQTLYAVYGTKAELVRSLVRRLRDDPGADAAFGEALAASSTDQALTAFARSIRRRWQGGHDIVAIHADAASADPGLRAEAEMALAARRGGIATLARHLADISSVGPDVVETSSVAPDAAELAAIIDALTLPELYAELTIVHGWAADRYETWLGSMLRTAVRGATAPEAVRLTSPDAIRPRPGARSGRT
jgi:AcrR family transcriptional regulator